jgi:hypothetical protein
VERVKIRSSSARARFENDICRVVFFLTTFWLLGCALEGLFWRDSKMGYLKEIKISELTIYMFEGNRFLRHCKKVVERASSGRPFALLRRVVKLAGRAVLVDCRHFEGRRDYC